MIRDALASLGWPGAARTRFRPRLTETPEAQALLARLEALGLRPVAGIRLTLNRNVMVGYSRTRVLSIHRGFTRAPDAVLHAVVRFIAPGTRRAVRKAAEREVLSFRAHEHAPGTPTARRRDRPRPGDAALLERLADLFRRYNAEHFEARLPAVPLRVSGRMRTRLGHLSLGDRGAASGGEVEISISRRHIERDGWDEAGHTLLHEMVHLWQHANGHPVDHGPRFRARARAVGVTASALRWVRAGAGAGRRRGTAARTD